MEIMKITETYVVLNSSANNTVITGGTTEVASDSDASVQQSPGLFGNFGWSWIIIYVVVIGGYIWFISRNNKKKEQKVEEMRAALKVGDNVCTTGGLFGKIAEINDEAFIIEFGTNRGVKIPVTKRDVIAAKDPLVKTQKTE